MVYRRRAASTTTSHTLSDLQSDTEKKEEFLKLISLK
jgi:hypothetical protein